MRGRRAVLPQKGWKSDEEQADAVALKVTLRREDAVSYSFALTLAAGPSLMRAQIVSAVASHCASESGWRRVSSVSHGKRGVSSWLRWIDEVNLQRPEHPILELSQVTALDVVAFRRHLREDVSAFTKRPLSASSARGFAVAVNSVLLQSQELHQTTHNEVRKRIGDAPRPLVRVARYSPDEFREIRNSARRVFSAAHHRIVTSVAEMEGHGAAEATGRANALREVLRTGVPSSNQGYRELHAFAYPNVSKSRARRWLFLTAEELLAAAVLIACRRGLNLAPMALAHRPYEHEKGVVQLDLDKPRRGPDRFWPEIVPDEEPSELDPGDATTLVMIEEATQPARDHLALVGAPTERLLVWWSNSSRQPLLGLAKPRTAAWLPGGVILSFPRLRRSVPGKGVAKEPTDHDVVTYLRYTRTDPIALAQQQLEGAKGIQDARDRARSELHIKILRNRDAPAQNDAVIANCSNPEENPRTKTPCTLGFFSFLSCLECGNAATSVRLLPAQLATIYVLEQFRSSLDGKAWEQRFARSYYTLTAMVERHSATEVSDAEKLVAQHMPRVMAGLRMEAPR